MADESSEARRFTYKKKQTNKRPVKKADKRAKPPTREKSRPALGSKVPRGHKMPREKIQTHANAEGVNVAKTTDPDRAHARDVQRWWEMVSADRRGDEKYLGADRPIIERERPPGGPEPMIQPLAGPVGQMRSQAAHTYGYSPEAYEELRQVPIRAYPPQDEYEKSVGGYYSPKDKFIYVNTANGMEGRIGTVAHEQSHAMFDRAGLDAPDTEAAYQQAFNDWKNSTLPSGQPLPDNAALAADNDLRDAMTRGYYGRPWPTEEYARTVEFSPNTARNWPDSVRPYYRDFLQGMDTLSTGEPTPPPPGDLYEFQPEGPDEGGNWGRPWRRW